MGDLTENINLNAKAADKAEDAALVDFLSYVDSGKAGSKFTQAIDAETKRVRSDQDWRERFVTWEMDLKIIRKDAEEKGVQAGIAIGKAEGKKEGEKNKALSIAKSLKDMGTMTEADIAKVTALPLSVVAAL